MKHVGSIDLGLGLFLKMTIVGTLFKNKIDWMAIIVYNK